MTRYAEGQDFFVGQNEDGTWGWEASFDFETISSGVARSRDAACSQACEALNEFFGVSQIVVNGNELEALGHTHCTKRRRR